MIYQNDPKLLKYIQKYGCAFMSIAWYREKYQGISWTYDGLNLAWQIALDNGIISGDLNHDGDLDDTGECEIQDWQKLCNVLGCNLRYVSGHYPIDSPLAKGCYTITAWYNPNTKFTHFVVGSKKPVEYDPISGGSKTVREGAPLKDGLRIFQIV